MMNVEFGLRSAGWCCWLSTILAGLSLGCGPSAPSQTPRFVVSDDPPFAIDSSQAYTFGYLEVPENRAEPDSRIIRLPVYVFRSRNPDPASDPVIYLVGGPGNSAMRNAPYMDYYAYLDDRDLILFEQRGTTYAQPHLGCPEWSEARYALDLPAGEWLDADSLFVAAAKACRERLTSEGIDLDGYRTTEIAADINDLLDVLDIEQYNLLTLSYGTKIAQALMRDYPDKIRSVVMDSPLPLEVSYDEESVGNLLAALDSMLADCAAQPACREAFPDLRERLYAFLAERSTDPLEIAVPHPQTGKQEVFLLRGKDLILPFSVASTADVEGLPLLFDRLLGGDYQELETALSGRFGGPGPSDGLGMRLSVWCAEEFPFVDQEVVARETEKYPPVQGLSPAVFSEAVCQTWNVRAEPDREHDPVRSDIPVLLLSGSYDNETPPKWARAMQNNLPNSYHLILPGWRHTPTTHWMDDCASQAAHAFFNQPDQAPDPDCLRQLEPPHFITE